VNFKEKLKLANKSKNSRAFRRNIVRTPQIVSLNLPPEHFVADLELKIMLLLTQNADFNGTNFILQLHQ